MKTKFLTNYDENSKYVSFFKNQRDAIKITWFLSSIPVIGVFSFFLCVFILPFAGVNTLMSIPYIGWPIYSLIFILIWAIGLSLWINMYSKLKLTDFQFIKERQAIVNLLVVLLIPSLFLTAVPLFKMRTVKETKEFVNYWNKNNNKMGDSDLWLSDKMPMKMKESASLAAAWMMIIMWALIIIWPLYQLIKTAFNGNLEQFITEKVDFSFSFRQFSRLFSETEYSTWMFNTLYVAIITLVIVILGSCFTAFIYSRYKFKTKKLSLITIMTLGLFPAMAGMITHMILARLLFVGLQLDRLIYLILIYSMGGILGNIFVLKGYLDSISTEIDDAARIDGCNTWQVFSKVIFPLMKPMLAVVGLGAFTAPFGDYMLPKLLLDENSKTLAVGLQELSSNKVPGQEPLFLAGSIIIGLPISILYLFLQRYMKSGTTSGGVKG